MIVYPHGCSRNQIYNASYHNMMRARYGTGVFLNLEKRICNINIELTPNSEAKDDLRIDLCINDDLFVINTDAVLSSQFYLFLHAVYCLYDETHENHHRFRETTEFRSDVPRFHYTRDENNKHTSIKSTFKILGYGEGTQIDLSRNLSHPPADADIVELRIISSHYGRGTYNINGKDLCYAIAKACTKALKKYGIRGYSVSTTCNHALNREYFDINELLFVKAYALNAMHVRELYEVERYYDYEYPDVYDVTLASSFDKEIELLLFDM